MTDRIKRHKGTRYVRVYCHWDNLYANALGSSVGASSGEDEPDPVLSGGYPCPSYKCSSRSAIYLDKSNPEKGSVVICTYSGRDAFFVPLTQNRFMWLLVPSQTASAPNRVRVISTGLEIPVSALIEGANQPLYQHYSMKFQDNVLLVARVIPDEFVGTYSSLHFLPLVTNLFLPRVTLEVFNTLLQQWVFSDPNMDYHTTDPYEAYLIAPIIVDGVQSMGVVVIMKSYNLPPGDANNCVEFLTD